MGQVFGPYFNHAFKDNARNNFFAGKLNLVLKKNLKTYPKLLCWLNNYQNVIRLEYKSLMVQHLPESLVFETLEDLWEH